MADRPLGPSLQDRVEGSAALRRHQRLAVRITRAISRVESVGLDRVPATGPLLLAANHRSVVDGPLLFGLVSRPATWLVKPRRSCRDCAGCCTPAGRSRSCVETVDPAPLRLCLGLLRAGGVVGIFPEGSRGPVSPRPPVPASAGWRCAPGRPCVPVACHGTSEVTHRRTLRRPPVRVVVGEPIASSGGPTSGR